MVKYRKYKDKAVLLEDFTFVHKANIYRIPKGFVWDGASIPCYVRWMIGKPFDKHFIEASLIHDWCYTVHLFSRTESDDLLYEYLIHNKTPESKAKVMYEAVRLVGLNYWINDSDDIDQIEFLVDYIMSNGLNPNDYNMGTYNALYGVYEVENARLFDPDDIERCFSVQPNDLNPMVSDETFRVG